MSERRYDYLIVGSGLFGATIAYRLRKVGKKCLVIEKRSHLGGNVYCEENALYEVRMSEDALDIKINQ